MKKYETALWCFPAVNVIADAIVYAYANANGASGLIYGPSNVNANTNVIEQTRTLTFLPNLNIYIYIYIYIYICSMPFFKFGLID